MLKYVYQMKGETNMKKWETPTIETLDVKCTEHGNSITPKVDDSYVDANGNHWWSFSGEAPKKR